MSTRSTWLNRRQIDGGIDRVALPDGVPGRLWLCGKHAIAPDRQRLVEEVGGAATIVCLVERHELAERYPEYVKWLDASDREAAVWWPIPDLHAPDADQIGPLVADLVARLEAGETLVVHCGAGMGRAGTTAACVLIRLGVDADEAVRAVAAARPGAGPEAGAQRQLVVAFAASGAQDERGEGDG
jgi:atypical dual specificity phosphatase